MIELIFTNEKNIISTNDVDWKIWQKKLYSFKTSIKFNNSIELIDFLQTEYNINEISIKSVNEILSNSNSCDFEWRLDNNLLIIEPINFDLLNSNGEIIDWKDWEYFFSKKNNEYFLWVYLGGIAELVREIQLSEIQIENWKLEKNEFIKNLSKNLRELKSLEYKRAILEHRKII